MASPPAGFTTLLGKENLFDNATFEYEMLCSCQLCMDILFDAVRCPVVEFVVVASVPYR